MTPIERWKSLYKLFVTIGGDGDECIVLGRGMILDLMDETLATAGIEPTFEELDEHMKDVLNSMWGSRPERQ